MLKKLEQILREHELVEPGNKLLVAVSGGADSIALLHLLSRLAPDFPFSLMAAHLDHGLRSESAADAVFVNDYCNSLEIPIVTEVKDIARYAEETRTGLEDAGRQARRHFLERTATENGCAAIVLAHHADDQAETVLFRLMRGSGLSGLAAMRMKSGPYIRPLLNFQARELRDYLQQGHVVWREDASNQDLDFSRNRIRHQLMPLLGEFNPQVVAALNRLSSQAADEEDYWQSVAADFLDRHGCRSNEHFEMKIEPLRSLSRAERRRILRSFLSQTKPALSGIDFRHIEMIEAMLESDRPQADLNLPGLWVGRRYDRLLCGLSSPDPVPYELVISGPGDYVLPNGECLRFSVEMSGQEDDGTVLFSADHVPFPLRVRSPRSGDRFQPSGMAGNKLLKDYFIDAKIDRESRRLAPVVCFGKEILWLVGMRRSGKFYPADDEKRLKIRLLTSKQVVE